MSKEIIYFNILIYHNADSIINEVLYSNKGTRQ